MAGKRQWHVVETTGSHTETNPSYTKNTISTCAMMTRTNIPNG